MKDLLFYCFLRTITYPFSLLPLWMIHLMGKPLGLIAYYLLPKYRKRTLSNLALAKDLNLSSKEIKKVAKKSFQNLAIVILEYPKFTRERTIKKHIICKNSQTATKLYNEGVGIIFFCAHQANWETLFLEGTTRMKGIAIGKPIKNKRLYNWILSLRQQFGGRIIEPKKALKESLKALRKGVFVGILGDQGMPTSDFSSSFLGTKAWTTTAPALLSIKTNSPIIFAETRREFGKYIITYSDPIYPNQNNPTSTETTRIMNHLLSLLEESIKKRPHEWLWQHNRYKQHTPSRIYKEYRHDSLLIILPKEKAFFERITPHIPLLLKIYEGSFVTLLVPEEYKQNTHFPPCELITYTKYEQTLLDDFRFKLVFNFTSYSKINRFYSKKSAIKVFSLKNPTENLGLLLKKVILRK